MGNTITRKRADELLNGADKVDDEYAKYVLRSIIDSLVAEDEPEGVAYFYECDKCHWVGDQHHTTGGMAVPNTTDCPRCHDNKDVSYRAGLRLQPAPQPKPIPWEAGDWAWAETSEGWKSLVIITMVSVNTEGRTLYNYEGECLGVFEAEMFIPTFDQLRTPISGGITAMATEKGDGVHVYFSNGVTWHPQTADHRQINKAFCEMVGIPVVTKRQVDAQFNGCFPPRV